MIFWGGIARIRGREGGEGLWERNNTDASVGIKYTAERIRSFNLHDSDTASVYDPSRENIRIYSLVVVVERTLFPSLFLSFISMAYARHHDPYGQAPQQTLVPDYPPVHINHNQYNDYDTQFDTKSAHSIHSSFHGSQAHLNPEYNMSRPDLQSPVNYHAYQPNYPPMQSPPMVREMSIGYSVAREKLMKRRSLRQVELRDGNLVLDVHVPSHIIPKGMSDVEEMTKLRYTAATCDPDEFIRKKYSLRPYLYGRHTELFIVMTMYNEDEILFVKTMNAYAFLSVQ